MQLKVWRQVTATKEIEAGKTVVTTSEAEETHEFGDGLEWEQRDNFLVFSDKDGKRLVLNANYIRAFEFTGDY